MYLSVPQTRREKCFERTKADPKSISFIWFPDGLYMMFSSFSPLRSTPILKQNPITSTTCLITFLALSFVRLNLPCSSVFDVVKKVSVTLKLFCDDHYLVLDFVVLDEGDNALMDMLGWLESRSRAQTSMSPTTSNQLGRSSVNIYCDSTRAAISFWPCSVLVVLKPA